jgi:hypothetical protein
MLVKDPPLDRLAALLDYVSPVVSQVVLVVDERTDLTTQNALLRMRRVFVANPDDVTALDRYLADGPADVLVPFTWIGDFAAARNAALPYAKGDWILHLDPDELPSAQMLAFCSMVDQSPWTDYGMWEGHAHYDPRGYLFWTRGYGSGIRDTHEQEQDWHCRLFRRALGHWYKPVHELVSLKGMGEEMTRETALLPKAPRSAYLIHSKMDADQMDYSVMEHG